MVEPVRVVPFRRSAFQVALLLFVTLGLYVFVWAYFMRRACASLLEQEDQPIWKSIALIVPIFNFFMMFDLGKKIQGVQWRADPQRVDGWLPWAGVSMFVFTVLGRLKGNAGYLGVFGYAPIALMHHRFVKAQIALLGEAGVPTGFHWAEWIVLVLGGGFWCLGLIGILLPPSPGEFAPGERTWFLSCIVLAVVGLVVVAVASRRAIAEGRAMHADPSPERIAPYVQ